MFSSLRQFGAQTTFNFISAGLPVVYRVDRPYDPPRQPMATVH
jgi:hypothetical protein